MGGIGFLIVLVLLLICVGLFFAMRGSLRRLGQSERDGTFGRRQVPGSPDVGPRPPD